MLDDVARGDTVTGQRPCSQVGRRGEELVAQFPMFTQLGLPRSPWCSQAWDPRERLPKA